MRWISLISWMGKGVNIYDEASVNWKCMQLPGFKILIGCVMFQNLGNWVIVDGLESVCKGLWGWYIWTFMFESLGLWLGNIWLKCFRIQMITCEIARNWKIRFRMIVEIASGWNFLKWRFWLGICWDVFFHVQIHEDPGYCRLALLSYILPLGTCKGSFFLDSKGEKRVVKHWTAPYEWIQEFFVNPLLDLMRINVWTLWVFFRICLISYD